MATTAVVGVAGLVVAGAGDGEADEQAAPRIAATASAAPHLIAFDIRPSIVQRAFRGKQLRGCFAWTRVGGEGSRLLNDPKEFVDIDRLRENGVGSRIGQHPRLSGVGVRRQDHRADVSGAGILPEFA